MYKTGLPYAWCIVAARSSTSIFMFAAVCYLWKIRVFGSRSTVALFMAYTMVSVSVRAQSTVAHGASNCRKICVERTWP